MKIVSIRSSANAEQVRAMLSDAEATNKGVKFDFETPPRFHVKESDGNVRIGCERTDKGRKDNGFIQGTKFYGRVKETENGCKISGIILTEPVFHLLFLAMLVFFVVLCLQVGGFSPTPPILVVFVIFMFKDEYRKQGMISRYISRAVRRAEPSDAEDENGRF